MATQLIRIPFKFIKGVGGIALQPVVAAAALAFLELAPSHLVDHVTSPQLIKDLVGVDGLKRVLRIFLALGIGRAINNFWNSVASNNWHIRSHRGWKWNNEIAVVTGGCNGIGKAIVLALVEKGVQVAILDVADLPPDLAKNRAVSYWKCDITSPEAIREAADGIRKRKGHPSILINNAGIANARPILESSHDELSRIFGINLQALWSTAREFLPTMVLKNKGHIVTIASIASYVALPGGVDYSATKAGALAFNEGLACEIKNFYKSPGVMTTVVHPSWVRTNMTAEEEERIKRGYGRLMEPEDVAKAVVKQVTNCRGAQIYLPASESWYSLMRGFPNWVQEAFRDILG